ncbi:IS110 family transposase [Butyrivibrio sp. AE2032]|uniref:IS110 family transposase n=1 Tax=Butyrivibrio sp. AE2032 TaxID=1458463 RepID=UPI000558F338|nr:IS110 family transposase [Butyrivibrio sp. AE2032]
MNRIIKIGMDVHSSNYTLCAMEPVIGAEDRVFANIQVTPDYKNILMFIENLKHKLGAKDTYDIECGYEAGCLGYSLCNQLTSAGVKCVILAPTTMLTQQGQRIKTDSRDALMIAQCLSYGGYHAVYIPTEDDDSVKEYLRMRDDHKQALKKVKQQINAFCLRHGYQYEGTKWTIAHIKWLKKLELSSMYQETLNEYMASYDEQTAKIERFDARIEEIASQARYSEKVKKLECFLGIQTHTALSLIVETGDFKRFAKGNIYAAYLGLAPGEFSSAEKINRLGITKAGNSHLRKLLVEASGGICKGAIGHKSKVLKQRQQGNSAETIAYADKANTRLRSKYYRLIRHGKKRNVAVAAIARELACFVWGMMTDNIGVTVE